MRHFKNVQLNDPWDMIEESEPDEIDLEMLADIENNPDCNVFMSEEEMDTQRLARNQDYGELEMI